MAFARSSSGPAGLSINTGAANSLCVPVSLSIPSFHLPCGLYTTFPFPPHAARQTKNKRTTRSLTDISTAAPRVSRLQLVVSSAQPARPNLQLSPTVSSATPPPTTPPSPPRLLPSSVLLLRIQTQIPSSRKQQEEVYLGDRPWPQQQNLAACLATPQAQQRRLQQEAVSLVLPPRRHNLNRPEVFSARLPLRRNHNNRAVCSAARLLPTRLSHSKRLEVSLAQQQLCKNPPPRFSEALQPIMPPPTHNQQWALWGQVCSARSPPKQAVAACCMFTSSMVSLYVLIVVAAQV